MYNQTTKSFTAEDASGSYSWIVENYDSSDYVDMGDAEIYEWIDDVISNVIDNDDMAIEVQASVLTYPVYGYTTGQQFADEDEYIEFKKQELRDDMKAERESVFAYIKEWIAS